ncbi:hypothetical protein HDU79_010926 [Rhizoclosmatium sp. JEL0117]|nr:hypothetical protein HDU79_010926 [Rhizoclosmatium sp. JEL0117]
MADVKDPNTGETKKPIESETIADVPPPYTVMEMGSSTATSPNQYPQPQYQPPPAQAEAVVINLVSPESSNTQRPSERLRLPKIRTGFWPLDLIIQLIEAIIKIVAGILSCVFLIVINILKCLAGCLTCGKANVTFGKF